MTDTVKSEAEAILEQAEKAMRPHAYMNDEWIYKSRAIYAISSALRRGRQEQINAVIDQAAFMQDVVETLTKGVMKISPQNAQTLAAQITRKLILRMTTPQPAVQGCPQSKN